MASDKPEASAEAFDEAADLAKAFQELAKGERTATALENQLGKMEARIEALLAQAENEQKEVQQIKSNKAESSADGNQTEAKDNDREDKKS